MESESIRWVTSDADMAVLPRGRHSLSPEAVKDSQRGRMLRAVALAVAEKGYGETVVTDVIERAHVSRKTFYEHFADLQDCFRQAHATACDTLLGEVVEASRTGPQEGFETIRSGIGGYFELIAGEPEMTQAFFADAVAAGPAVARKREETMASLAALILAGYRLARDGDPSLPEPLPLAGTAATGAINEVCLSAIAEETLEQLPGKTDETVALIRGILTAGAA
ncbi:MAG: TetR/AcrR family transcriptional regulator [Solirubrobacterales bacterium]